VRSNIISGALFLIFGGAMYAIGYWRRGVDDELLSELEATPEYPYDEGEYSGAPDNRDPRAY
jgi:hypothetical protein